MSRPRIDPAGTSPLGAVAGATPADDPLARIGRQLVGAAVVRRRRHRAQRATGAALTVVALVGAGFALRSLAGEPGTPAGGQRVELSTGDGRFAVHRTGGGPLCADRPNGRDRQGTTICANPDLVRDLLRQRTRTAWLQARVVGDRVVVTGLAAADARIVVTAPSPGGFAGGSAESTPGGPAVTISRDGEPRSVARPFVLTLPRTGAGHVQVSAPTGTGPTIVEQLAIGETAPPGLFGYVQLRYFAGSPERVAERAQQRLQGAGVARAQVVEDGDSLTAWVTGPQVGKARAALMPGLLTAYDWEASAVRPDAVPERLADAQRRQSRQPGSARIVQALGRGGSLPARHDPRARFYVVRGLPPLVDTPRLSMRPPSGGSGEPVWQLDFDAAQRGDLQRLTRAVARRGQNLMRPGVTATAAAQHVALVLDGRLLALVAIDPRRLPDGVRGGVLELPPSFVTSGAVRQAGVLQRGPLPAMKELP